MRGRQYRKNISIKDITGWVGYFSFLAGISYISIYFGFLQDFFGYEIYGDELNMACFYFFLSSLSFGVGYNTLEKLWGSK